MAEYSKWKGLFLGIIRHIHCKNLYGVKLDEQYFFFLPFLLFSFGTTVKRKPFVAIQLKLNSRDEGNIGGR